MRSKSIVLLALALGCGLVASIGISQVMERRNQATNSPGETEAIFVALSDINPNEPLTAQNVKIEEWPKSKIQNGVITKVEEYENKRARQKIFAGEPILLGKIIDANASGSAGTTIPKGYRVVAVRVDAVAGAGSLILPGDRIDVLVFFSKNPANGIEETKTQTILQDIKVFAVDTVFQRSPGEDEQAIAAKTISLLVTPDQAEKVMLASELGSVRLILRHDQDDSVTETHGAGMNDVIGGNNAGNRGSEQTKPQTSIHPTPGPTNVAQNLLDFVKKQRQQTKAAPPSDSGPWTMTVLKGSEVQKLEISKDGLPVVVGEACATALPGPPPSQENPDESPTEESSDTPTTDQPTDEPAAEPHVSLKE